MSHITQESARENMMILAIDCGNTRTKWGVFDSAGELRAHGVCLNAELDSMATPAAWLPCGRVVVSNVAGAGVEVALKKMLGALNASIRWVTASEKSCGLRNGYQTPARLGSDRWAAMVAAWQHFRQPCIAVNAGTAMTVDAIGLEEGGQGIFLGGLIVPGLGLMQKSLARGPAGLGEFEGSVEDFPVNTADAIRSGALSAMAGAVESLRDRLQRKAGGILPYCVISGGDAQVLADALLARCKSHNQPGMEKKLVIADNLVLQGLLLIERETS